MFKCVLAISLMFVSISSFGFMKKNTIVLTDQNTLVMRGVFTNESVSKVQKEAIRLSMNLPKHKPIYLFMDTPGGSIVAGQELITTLQSLPQKIHTITNFSASMGYITVQSLNTRYVLPHGVLMSHRATIGDEGQIPGEFLTRLNYWIKRLININTGIAKRLNMPVDDYNKMIYNEYWVDGQDAVDQKQADYVMFVQCDKSLNSTYKETVYTMFGAVDLIWSKCPMIGYPVEIQFNGMKKEEQSKVMAIIRDMINNKVEFTKRYIITNKYMEIFK